MSKVIETNIRLSNNGEYVSHQSRVIEVDSWASYVDEIKTGKYVMRNSIIGSLSGASLPRNAIVEDLQYDSVSMSFVFYDSFGIKYQRLSYLVR